MNTETGFGWFENKVQKYPNKFLRVPHNGWNNIRINNKSSLLLKILMMKVYFYFNHSHAIDGRNL